ncbi:MAG: CHASE3 domain-containing protein [Dehalococcoidia bacterium]|nr:CHASE3 domain-containing protein [Dehalococcoidia bacterium]
MRDVLSRQLLAQGLAVVAAMLAIGIVTVLATRSVVAASEDLDRSHARVTALAELLSVLQDIETGQRGFLLTGDAAYLEPYDAALERLEQAWDAVAAQVHDASRLAVLRAEIDARTQIAADAVERERTGDERGAESLLLSGAGKARMDAIRGQVAALRTDAEDDLQAAHNRVDRTAIGATLAMVALVAVALTVLGFGFGRLRAEALARRRADFLRTEAEAGLRTSEARYRGLFRAMADAAIVTDDSAVATDYNPAFIRLLGYGPFEFVGHSARELYISDDAWREAAELAGKTAGGRFLTNLRRKDGELVPVAAGLSTITSRDGERLGFLGVIRDMSEEEAQRARIEALNRDLDQRNTELEVANAELESFSYSVSHDLRAPLRAVAGFTQVLQEDYADRLDAEGLGALHRVRAAAGRMGQLIDDLLALSRVTRAELRRERTDLSAIATSIANDLQRAHPERPVGWDISPGVIVEGDPPLLRIALENLLGNAYKFTGNVDQPRIAFGVTTGENGANEYYVRDNGAGFDMEYAGKLFSPFQRLHRTEEFEGTGIGLATVHRIIRRHGGTIRAEGAVGAGAAVFFTLPAQAAT